MERSLLDDPGTSLDDPSHERSVPRNVKMLSVSFFVLFFAFFSGQNYVTSVLGPALGDISLGLIYGLLCLGAIFAPWGFAQLRRIVGKKATTPALTAERHALAVGALCYAPFFASCATHLAAFQLVGSAVLGIGAALLWVAQGSVLTASSSHAHRERDAGIFWAGYMGGNAVGNLSAYAIQQSCPTHVLFLILSAVCVLGAGCCYLLVSPHGEERCRIEAPTQYEEVLGEASKLPAEADEDATLTLRESVVSIAAALTVPQVKNCR